MNNLISYIEREAIKVKEEGDYVKEITVEDILGGGIVIRTVFEVIVNDLTGKIFA